MSLLFISRDFSVWKLRLARGPSSLMGCALVTSTTAEVPCVSRDCPLVVVTPASGYVYCLCNWEYFLLVDFGGYCIVKDRAISAAQPRSCPHQVEDGIIRHWVPEHEQEQIL